VSNSSIEKHQLAGMDERERGFNRLVEIAPIERHCRASLRYETTVVVTGPCDTPAAALDHLIGLLHDRGYTQLRSRLSFQGNVYLGSRQEWIDYPDPARTVEPIAGLGGLLRRFRQALGL